MESWLAQVTPFVMSGILSVSHVTKIGENPRSSTPRWCLHVSHAVEVYNPWLRNFEHGCYLRQKGKVIQVAKRKLDVHLTP